MTRSQLKAADVSAQIRARSPLIWLVTPEEARIEKYAFEANASAGYLTRFWDIAAGVTGLDGSIEREFAATANDPDALLDAIREQKGTEENPNRCVWVLRDIMPWITGAIGATTQRRLRNLVRWLPGQPQWSAQAIIVISTSAEVPAELANHAVVIEWPMPDREEIEAILDATIAPYLKKLPDMLANGSRNAAIDAAVGLSGEEAQASFSRSLVQLRRIDPAAVAAEKERSIRSSGLEWLKPIPSGFKAVGGLDNWKQWAVSRAIARTPAAREYGLPTSKGALLVGVPGCGKTLSALALAGEWNVPAIKLDLGALKGKYVGQSEQQIRGAFGKLEAIGPCVVLADEIEKSLAGASGEAGDGGVAADALGALLTWMNDREGEAFVIATANNIDKLPPELLRKGRFDEVWWIGLPNEEERAGVMAAALASHGRDAETLGIDLEAIALATEQFSGAEIAALVPEAMFAAFAENAREITTSDILTAAKSVKPKGTNKVRPDFAREATSSIAPTASKGARGRSLDL